MPTWYTVAKVNEIASGRLKQVIVGGAEIALANMEGRFYAVSNECTHAACALSEEGQLEGEELTCNCHGSMFNVTTGEVLQGPAVDNLRSFKTRLEGDNILVEV